MKWAGYIFLFAMLFSHSGANAEVSSAWQAPFLNLPISSSEWTITHPSTDRVLLENKSKKLSVLIVETGSALSEVEADLFLTRNFVSEVKRSRPADLDLDGSSITNFHARTGQSSGRVYGATLFQLPLPDGNATFSERIWVEENRAWQISIASWATTTSDVNQLDALSEKLMDLIVNRGRYEALLPKDDSERQIASKELGRTQPVFSPTAPMTRASAPSIFPNPSAAECASIQIAQENRGSPPYELKLNQASFRSCMVGGEDAMEKWMASVKTAVIAGVTSVSKNTDENLRRHPCPRPVKRAGALSWLTYAGELEGYSSCLLRAGSVAVIQSGRDLVVATAQGIGALVNYVRTLRDPISLVTALVQKEVKGFKCLNAEAQMATVCEVLTHITGTLAATALTAGTGAALTAGAETTLAARGALALRAGLNAAKELVVLPVKIPRNAGRSVLQMASKIKKASAQSVSKVAALRASAISIKEARAFDSVFRNLAEHSGSVDSFKSLMSKRKDLSPDELARLSGRIDAANKKLIEIRSAYAPVLKETVSSKPEVLTLVMNAEAKGISRKKIVETIRRGLQCK